MTRTGSSRPCRPRRGGHPRAPERRRAILEKRRRGIGEATDARGLVVLEEAAGAPVELAHCAMCTAAADSGSETAGRIAAAAADGGDDTAGGVAKATADSGDRSAGDVSAAATDARGEAARGIDLAAADTGAPAARDVVETTADAGIIPA